ncbi:MAG: hypothetical protein EOO02_22565, partial [Chitinophagaceae bacterium]
LHGCLECWIKSLQSGERYLYEFRLQMASGEYLWHLAQAVPYTENNKTVLWLGTNTNIDLQKRNDQKKDEFLSIASHELKTPLTSIKAFNQLIQRTSDVSKLSSFIQKSAEHIFRLEKLINDLLDVTKINAGKMTYTMEPFSFKKMLTNSVESVQHTAATHKIELEAGDDINFNGDQLRLEQVVHNFLTNAIKYSPDADKVKVNYKIEQENIIVAVQDLGEAQLPGLADNEVVNTFPLPADFFQRPASSPSDNRNNKYDPALIGAGGYLNSSIREIATTNSSSFSVPGASLNEGNDFAKLENARKLTATEFSFNPKLGYISLQQRLSNDEVLAVAYQYTIGDDVYQVGEFANDGVESTIVGEDAGTQTVSTQSLILKMLKGNLTVVNNTTTGFTTPVWNLMMKNIY